MTVQELFNMEKVKSSRGSIDYKATVKAYKEPEIQEEYMDDEGNIILILKSGLEVPKDKFEALWRPVKTKILPKMTKVDNTKNAE